MQKEIKKMLCLLMAATTFPLFTGCLSETENLEVVGTDQIAKDTYIANSEINKYVTYWFDYGISKEMDDVEVTTMYNFFDIQIDDWNSAKVGVTKMGELISSIERSNRHYIMRKTEAILDERQDKIDREYAKNVKDAEAKEKTKKTAEDKSRKE